MQSTTKSLIYLMSSLLPKWYAETPATTTSWICFSFQIQLQLKILIFYHESLIMTWYCFCNHNAKPYILKQRPRTCSLYHKTNWPEFRKFMESSEQEVLSNPDTISIEKLWQGFKTTLEKDISEFVPSKKICHIKSLT